MLPVTGNTLFFKKNTRNSRKYNKYISNYQFPRAKTERRLINKEQAKAEAVAVQSGGTFPSYKGAWALTVTREKI